MAPFRITIDTAAVILKRLTTDLYVSNQQRIYAIALRNQLTYGLLHVNTCINLALYMPERYRVVTDVYFHSFTSTTKGGEWSTSYTGHCTPALTEGWIGAAA